MEIVWCAPEQLAQELQGRRQAGDRWVGMTARREEREVILLYHLGQGMALVHYGVRLEDGRTFPSVSRIFPGAWLYENEIQDQFGIRFSDLTLDFGGKLFLYREESGIPWGPPEGSAE